MNIKDHGVTLNQLIRICEDTTWEDFEAVPDGRLALRDHAQTLIADEELVSQFLWVFQMRVGTHFERPMQAIMCAGHFIRMRSAEQWEVSSLRKLDPTKPDNCLYRLDYLYPGAMLWQPTVPVTWTNKYSTSLYPVVSTSTTSTTHHAGGSQWTGVSGSGGSLMPPWIYVSPGVNI